MNLFRSEEHAKAWGGFKADSEGGIVPLDVLARLFSGPMFKRRLDPDYVSHIREYMRGMATAFHELGPYWQLK